MVISLDSRWLSDSSTQIIRFSRRALIASLITFSTVPDAHSQPSPLDVFTKEFNGIAVWTSLGFPQAPGLETRETFKSNKLAWRYGFELFLGPFPAPSKKKLAGMLETARDSLLVDSLKYLDSLPSGERRQLKNLQSAVQAQDESAKVERKKGWSVDVGVGLDFSDSYRPQADSLDIRIPVMAFYISAYVSLPEFWNLPYYLGGTAGIYTISNGTAYTNTLNQFEMSGSTFAFELIPLGISVPNNSRNAFFLELSYQYLAFDGVRYKGTGGLPLGTPNRLDLSGWRVTFGVQLAKK